MNPSDVIVFGEHDENTLRQIRTVAADDRVAGAVLCADGHYGYSMPIGGVAGYRGSISPSGVGYDIACGNKAVRVDIPAGEVRSRIPAIMDDIWRVISFGMGRKNNEPVDHPLFDDTAWAVPAAKGLKDKARAQLGTVGSGNHYVDVFTDELDRVWVGVHFGSRGFGHGIATHFLKAAGPNDNSMDAPPCVLNLDSGLGQEYLACMLLAGRYAYAGRDWVCGRVAQLMEAEIVEEVHNHHNFAWLEKHGGEDLWVVRKGATPSRPGQRGFVGGSMGDCSVILKGVKSDRNDAALLSTVHGAGRVMSRTQAAGKRGRHGKPREGGQVTQEMMYEWVVQRKGVELRGAGRDESPHCYRRLPDVLAQHDGTFVIEHTLTPLGVAMAGPDELDPYKD